MRRLTLFALFAFLLVPASVEAQPRIMAGAGFSSPTGDFGDSADTGWHGMVGLQLGLPGIPIAARADGSYHSFGEGTTGGINTKTKVLGGALSAVVTLPGVGIGPYLLGGIGVARSTTEVTGSPDVTDSDPSFHLAGGVNIGALGFGGFGEVRWTRVNGDGSDLDFITATVGIRL